MNPEPDYTPHLIGIRRLLQALLGVLLLKSSLEFHIDWCRAFGLFAGVVLLLISLIQWLFFTK